MESIRRSAREYLPRTCHGLGREFCGRGIVRTSRQWQTLYFTRAIIIERELPHCRGFHRFELYCNLLHVYDGDDGLQFIIDKQCRLFFDAFTYWENEQLACIHDYLHRCIATGTWY